MDGLTKTLYLQDYTTAELVDELKKRDGVETNIAGPSSKIIVEANGPAIVLVVID